MPTGAFAKTRSWGPGTHLAVNPASLRPRSTLVTTNLVHSGRQTFRSVLCGAEEELHGRGPGAPLPHCRVGVIVALDSDRCVSEPETDPSLADADVARRAPRWRRPQARDQQRPPSSPGCVDESEIARRTGGEMQSNERAHGSDVERRAPRRRHGRVRATTRGARSNVSGSPPRLVCPGVERVEASQ
jgi:hypothetical protein